MISRELKIFFTALMFYTRIPCLKIDDYSPDDLNKATRYFPLIGWIVGGISFGVFWLSSLLFDVNISVIFSLIAGVLVTGAFHEDGLADMFDGFGGGWTKEKILEIMKDSRVGAYGAISLIFLFAIKFFALNNLLSKTENTNYLLIFLIFIAYHSLSRLTAINIVFTSRYSREDAGSKSKPIAKAHTFIEVVGAYFFGLLPLILLCFFSWKFSIVMFPLAILYFFTNRYFNRWIDGYTGDCLGAVEQMAECGCLLTFLALWKFM
jgi:adenosylcobinamide-GDP ribazoletransferase